MNQNEDRVEGRPGSRKTRKIAAIAAGALVIGVGATYTLAAWNDAEWVWGGTANGSGDPGVGTSTFEVVQNTSSPFDNAAGNWANRESNPGGALQFTVNALTLSPGDVTYAPVALRTVTDSLAADVTLQPAVAATGAPAPQNDADLFAAIRVTVYTAAGATPPSACTAGFTGTGWTQILVNQPLATVATSSQQLSANGGSTQHYCFALTLPTSTPGIDALQGKKISPAWRFEGVSS